MVNIIITLSDTGNKNLAKTKMELEKSGLTVTQVLKNIGIIHGKAEPGQMKKLAALRFVKSVEISKSMSIAPPDSLIQ